MAYENNTSLEPKASQSELSDQVAKKELRKIKARRDQGRGIWYGLGMFGLVGWSVATPMLVGIAIGIWMDRRWEHKSSCTLTGMFVGLVIGCWIAWYWVKRESLAGDATESGESANELDDKKRGAER